MESSDRARLIVLGVLTLLAVPFLIKDQGSSKTNSPAAVSGTGGGDIAAPLRGSDPATGAGATGADSSIRAGFLGDPTQLPSTQPVVIGVPPAPSDTMATGKAGFRRWAADSVTTSRPCATAAAPIGARIIVTNLDNGHTTLCIVVSQRGMPATQLIQLDSSVFSELADLIDSPIPVRLNW